MRKKTHVLSLLLACATAFGQSSYDLVIVGGNPGGIMAAISAARMGKKSVILERTRYVGGLPANGLGATDIATRAATTGLFREFVDGVKQHRHLRSWLRAGESMQRRLPLRTLRRSTHLPENARRAEG